MGFLDKAKSAAEQAAQKAKEGAEFAAQKAKETGETVQTKREIGNTYDELGHKARFRIRSCRCWSRRSASCRRSSRRERNRRARRRTSTRKSERPWGDLSDARLRATSDM